MSLAARSVKVRKTFCVTFTFVRFLIRVKLFHPCSLTSPLQNFSIFGLTLSRFFVKEFFTYLASVIRFFTVEKYPPYFGSDGYQRLA